MITAMPNGSNREMSKIQLNLKSQLGSARQMSWAYVQKITVKS